MGVIDLEDGSAKQVERIIKSGYAYDKETRRWARLSKSGHHTLRRRLFCSCGFWYRHRGVRHRLPTIATRRVEGIPVWVCQIMC